MKNSLALKQVLLGVLILTVVYLLPRRIESHDVLSFPQEKKVETPMLKPNEWMLRQRAYPSGKIDYHAYQMALKFKAKKTVDYQNQPNANKNENLWVFSGPTNIGGRITDIEMTSSNPQTLYAAAASGGIFKSGGEGGDAWQPIFDGAVNLSIGDMALAPSDENIMYVGTGESNAGGGSLVYDGNGVYKTMDGGDTWAPLGLENIGSVGKVLVNPTNPAVCYVGAMGHLFEKNEERGIYRTLDGGDTWENILFVNDSTGVIDMAIHPTQPDTLYAATWERVRTVNRRSYGGASSRIYRSYDGGDNWELLINGLPMTAGRIGITISPSNPEILYAIIADEDSGYLKGIYKSTNSGDSWALLNAEGVTDVPYMWWFGKIYVDPLDADIVYVAGFRMHKSLDGGGSWTTIFSDAHVDQHAICFNPQDNDMVFAGNDGGVYVSPNQGENFAKLTGLPITQFYTCEIDDSQPERIYGGAQDNSTMRTLTGSEDDWAIIYGGDGFRVLVNPVDNNIIYAEYQYGNLVKSTNGGNSFSFTLNGIIQEDRNNWNTPVVFDPNNPNTLYYGTQRLYKSVNGAASWSAISDDVTGNPISYNLTYGTITTISVSPVDGNVIWVGTDDGKVQVTTNGGDSWSLVSATLPDRWVTAVVANPTDATTAYVTFSGYRFGTNTGHVYATENLGAEWTDVSGDLPDIPINSLLVTPDNNLHIATDIGVYYSTNTGISWALLGIGLPNVVITDMDYHAAENILLAATFGRGLYTISLDPPLGVETQNNEKIEITAYPNPFVNTFTLSFSVEESQYFTIQLYDALGKSIYTEKQYFTAGTHTHNVKMDRRPSGVYFCVIRSENQTVYNKIQLVKR